MSQLERFHSLVHRGVEAALRVDGHCKSYEGRIELLVEVPSYHEREALTHWTLTLHCYVLGPGRHYTWHATSEDDLFRVATRDVQGWIEELRDDD